MTGCARFATVAANWRLKDMATIKTKPTKVSVKDFIAAVGNDARRNDAEALLQLFARATGWKAQMWGPTIVGFGSYHYKYASGHAGQMCVVGFSPRQANTVVYLSSDFAGYDALRARLGKAKNGAACIYISKLADVDLDVLESMVKGAVAATRKAWPVTAV